MQSMFLDHSKIKTKKKKKVLERDLEKFPSIWKLRNTLVNNTYVEKKLQKKFKYILKWKYKYSNLWDTAKQCLEKNL